MAIPVRRTGHFQMRSFDSAIEDFGSGFFLDQSKIPALAFPAEWSPTLRRWLR
jgi:hypothetical protein